MWTDELPFTSPVLPPIEPLVETLVPSVAKAAKRTRCTIEMLQPRGPWAMYGLLGCDYSAHEGNELQVVVPCGSAEGGIAYPDSLAGRMDFVQIAVDRRLAMAAITGVCKMHNEHESLPVGRISFSCMAHGAVGSAPIVFRILARAVIRLLQCDEPPRTPEEITSLVEPWRINHEFTENI